MMTALLPAADSYDDLVGRFRWQIPTFFNIAEACCDRWADGSSRLALLHVLADGRQERVTFDALKSASARLATVLTARGIRLGDRVAVLLPQGPEAAIAHLAVYRMGGIAVPLFQLFGPDALEFRLRDAGASALITDDVGLAKLVGIHDALSDLRVILGTRARGPACSPCGKRWSAPATAPWLSGPRRMTQR